jgi:hypothetical protein
MGLITTSISSPAGSISLTGSLLGQASGYGNSSTIDASLTIPTGYNFMLIGPITVDEDITLIISGSAILKIL